ncbi:glycosyltransferase [bacterium]|nr:glycosyltransferase [bacterium]
MTKPIISVLMGVHNGEQYLNSSISSILFQTFKDFEFIIVNDGSTDSSGKIIDKYAKKDSRIKVIHHENKGLTKSLNIAAQHAQGKYLARQDADDISLPKRLQIQIKYLQKFPQVKILGTSNYMIDYRGKVINRFLRPSSTEQIKKYMPFGNQLCHGSILAEKEFFMEMQGYDESYRYAQDYEFWFRVLSKGYQINNLRWPLYMWRIHDKSIAGFKLDKQKQIVEGILNKYAKYSSLETNIYDVKENYILDKYYLCRGLLHAGYTSLRYPNLQVTFI